MMLAGESQNNWSKPCPSDALPITNPKWTDLGLNLIFQCEEPHDRPPETWSGPKPL